MSEKTSSLLANLQDSVATHPIVEDATIQKLRELDDPSDAVLFTDDLIDTFLVTVPGVKVDLESSLIANDRPKMRSLAHKMKGLCWNLGVKRLASICQTVEENAEMIPQNVARPLIDVLSKEYELAIKDLKSRKK